MNPIDQSAGIKAQLDTVRPGSGTAPVAAEARGSNTQRANSRGDEAVTVTRTASELMRLEEQLDTLPEVDSERVEALRQAIAEGRYEVNPGRIADALIQVERELY